MHMRLVTRPPRRGSAISGPPAFPCRPGTHHAGDLPLAFTRTIQVTAIAFLSRPLLLRLPLLRRVLANLAKETASRPDPRPLFLAQRPNWLHTRN